MTVQTTREYAQLDRGRPSVEPQVGAVRQLAHGLGWFSIGLGATQLIAPGTLARFIGVPDTAKGQLLMRMMGVREAVKGAGILGTTNPAPWLWARAAGDVLDLATLGMSLRSRRARPARVAAAMSSVAGVLALDLLAGRQLSRPAGRDDAPSS